MTLTVLIFLTVTLCVGAVALVVRDYWTADEEQLRRRLSEEFANEKHETSAGSALFKNLDRATDKALRVDATSRLEPLSTRWRDLLEQAQLPFQLTQVALLSAGLAAVAVAALTWWRGPLLGIAGGFCAGIVPWWLVQVRARARREKYLRQLPTVFDLMSRVVRAGQSVQQAFQAVADSCDQPVAGEFARSQHQLNLGLSPEVAYQELARRSGILEMRLFVLAMLIQRQLGGNLAEVLDRLAIMIRARLRIQSQVKTHTAEGRLQGWTLVVLPFVLFGVLMVLNRPYAETLFQHPRLLVASFVSMTIGILWIRRIVNFEY
ncbi:MAG: type II secretion system F family protein [Gemmataceae bacterium]|nr:type II secretion system F family protein [Gemmataceae bacterium]